MSVLPVSYTAHGFPALEINTRGNPLCPQGTMREQWPMIPVRRPEVRDQPLMITQAAAPATQALPQLPDKRSPPGTLSTATKTRVSNRAQQVMIISYRKPTHYPNSISTRRKVRKAQETSTQSQTIQTRAPGARSRRPYRWAVLPVVQSDGSLTALVHGLDGMTPRRSRTKRARTGVV
ncbi:hypothetical protein C7212DRAFT_363756 [Tuber magnatum]|uniref:Uncharacterized protein n=1 Tax=Tuber magnatum TaxID=42249 RepID=A0A317SQS3_9PEZI|nr:hypothetical protein C7212DRAFT_363756 [Tuber magnatum]